MRPFLRLLSVAACFVALFSLLGADQAQAATGIDGFVKENMAPVMFFALVVFLLLGYPVAFALAANGLFFALVGIELGLFQENFLQALPERIYGTMNNDVLLAIPFFTFMGLVLERSGMAEDLLDTIGQLFGPVRGGLAYAVIFVGALLAATTGVVAASVIAMGLISLPIMLRYGYDRRVASGVIAASGTLAQIIPPSLVLIVMADQLGRSVGDMYEGAFIPGLILSGLYAGYIMLVSIFRPSYVPGLPPEAQRIHEDPALVNRQNWLTSIGLFIAYPVLVWVILRAVNGLLGYAGLGLPAQVITYGSVGLGVLAAAYGLFVRKASNVGTNARLNLLVLTVISGLLAVLFMKYRTKVGGGADFVVLSMSIAVALSFFIALTNRVLKLGLLSKMAEEVTFVMVPPLALIFLVLGTIFIGVATPTEGGAMGAVGAILLAGMKRVMSGQVHRLNWSIVRQAGEATAKLSAFVLFILIGARVFSLTFYGVNGHLWVEHLLVSLPGGQIGFLIFVNILIFLLAFFLDFFELAFIAVPLIGPAADKLGIDLIWFGVMLGVNMQTSFMHPPFGFALFYLRSVAPKEAYKDRVTGKLTEPVTTGQIYWGAVPFVVIQCIMVALVITFPQMVMHYKATAVQLDKKSVDDALNKLSIPGLDAPPIGGPGGLPGFDPSQPPKIQ
jgi:TRAP-type mannitol/chloroaromatic compound transport system permease large subunit